MASKKATTAFKPDPTITGFIDESEKAASAKKKKKKGLTEKELDFEQEFDDDNEEDFLNDDD